MSQGEQHLAQKVVHHMLVNDPFSRWLGIELVHVAPGEVRLQMRVRAEMLNGFGVCHGGIAFALADSALAFASNTGGKLTMSIENSITYPEKIVAGDLLTAETEKLYQGNRLATYLVNIHRQDGTLVAHFRGTVYQTRKDHFPAT